MVTRRAAFDIGSGSTKLQCTDCKIVRWGNGSYDYEVIPIHDVFSAEIPVQFGADLMRSGDGLLSEEIQQRGLNVFLSLKSEAKEVGATEFSAIATEVFRRASNGAEYLDRLRATGVPISLVSQTTEAVLGYQSVQCLMKRMTAADGIERSESCVWDSGGASFQITHMDGDDRQCYMGALGSSVCTSLLIKEIQGKPLVRGSTPNPVSREESERLMSLLTSTLEQPPPWLYLQNRVTSAAGENSMFRLCCIVLMSILKRNSIPGSGIDSALDHVSSFTLEQACEALSACLECSDDQLSQYTYYPNSDGPHLVVPKLCLLVAVMKHIGIKSVSTVHCIGSCVGLMCDSSYWSCPSA